MKKSKMLRTLLALALILTLAVSLTACGGTKGAGDASEKSYVIGFNTWGAGTATFDVMGDMIEDTIALYGSEGSRVSDDHMADKELQNVQNFISAEVDGIVLQTSADPVLPQASEVCKTAKTPFVLAIFVGDDADREKVSADNDYYVGAVNANLYIDGYIMGEAAAADGHKTAVLIGGNIGDNHFEQRIAGFTKAFVEEGGGTILDEARCTNPGEGQEKANALLAANKDAECVYAMVSDYVPGTVSAMETLGLSMPVYASNANKDCVDYIRSGVVAAAAGGNDIAGPIATALLLNYLDGHPIVDENGKAPEFKTIPFTVNADNVDDFERICFDDGAHPLTDAVLKSLAWRYNNDVTYDTFVDLIENGMTLEALKADHDA